MFPSKPPKIGDLQEKSPLRFEKLIVVEVTVAWCIPRDSLVQCAVAHVSNCSGDVGKRCKEVRQQSATVLIVLDNTAEEEIAVHLICQFLANNRVVIDLRPIRGTVKIGVDQTRIRFDVFRGLIDNRC